jgi:PTS system nitrogen regulatory IIA component
MQLTLRDAARLLQVEERALQRWIKDGEIPYSRVNEQYRFNRVELLEWATARDLPVSPDLFAESEEERRTHPSLTGALQAGGVFHGVPGPDVPAVLGAVVERLNLPEDVDREELLQILLAREALGSTGVGNGIAIPHVRNPIVLHVPEATVTLCFLEKPVDFKAVDGLPVHTLFTLVRPTVKGHLHLLSRLAFCLRDPAFRSAVQEREQFETLLQHAGAAEAKIPAARPTG